MCLSIGILCRIVLDQCFFKTSIKNISFPFFFFFFGGKFGNGYSWIKSSYASTLVVKRLISLTAEIALALIFEKFFILKKLSIMQNSSQSEVFTPSTVKEFSMEGYPTNPEMGSFTNEKEAFYGTSHQAPIATTVGAFLIKVFPPGGMLFCILSIASTSIGAGILGLPDAFSQTGILMSFAYLVAITAQTVYSMHILISVADETGLHSYEQMTAGFLHRHTLYFVAALRWIYCIGAQVSYVVTVGNLISPILEDADASAFLQGSVGSKLIQAGLWVVFFLPLCIPRKINSLRYVSAAGILMMIYFSLCVIIHYGLDTENRPPTVLATSGNVAIDGLGVFIFSYMCQINCVEIYYEMCDRSPWRFTLCATISLTLCGLLYGLTGLFGYMNFGDSLSGSILLKFNPIKDPYIMVSFIGVFIKVCASYGIYNNASCATSYQVLRWDPARVSFLKHLMLSIPFAILSAVLGIFIPNVNMVFGFTGGVCGGFLAFILPSLFYMYAGNWTLKTVGWGNYIATYLMLMGGCVAIVFGTASTIYTAVV